MSDKIKLELDLLDKKFTVACSSDQVEKFERASSFLSEKLSKLVNNNKGLDYDKAITMVSLNIVNELLQEQFHTTESLKKLENLDLRLNNILDALNRKN